MPEAVACRLPVVPGLGKMKTANRTLSAATTPFDFNLVMNQAGEEGSIVSCHKSKVFFSQGDSGDSVFYIQKGRVKLTVVSQQGKEAVIGILGPTDFFGESCLNGQTLRTSTATAMTECSLLRVRKAAAIRLLHDQRDFSEVFVSYLLSRNVRIEEDLTDQLFNSSELRLARALLLLTRFGSKDEPVPIVPKISQQTLAEMIGTTRSRVSFFMNKFKRLGYITYNNGLEVHSSLLSVVLHEPDHKPAQQKSPGKEPGPVRKQIKTAK